MRYRFWDFGVDLNFTSCQLNTSEHCKDHGYYAGAHCAYPWRDGQAELTWVDGFAPRWFTHPKTVTCPT